MRRLAALPLVCLAAVCGCSEEQIRIYELPKQPVPLSDSPEPGAVGPAALVFAAPEGWDRVPPVSGMVRRQFAVGEVTVTHTAFPGNVGGDLANLNRWRGQLGMPPVGAEAVEASIATRAIGDIVVRRVDLQHGGRRMVIDMIRSGGMTWFIKMDGPADTVAEALPLFDQHVASVRVDDQAEEPVG